VTEFGATADLPLRRFPPTCAIPVYTADRGRFHVTEQTVLREHVADGVALITLNRPDRGNGVVPELAAELTEVLDSCESDREVRAIVVTGAGRQFCAGPDLKMMRDYIEHEMPRTGEPYNARAIFPVIERFRASRLPLVAAINGGATAGGLDLALACDIRIASTEAKLGATYINIGLPPGNGGTWFLPRLVGSGVAAELVLTGDVVDAERALATGLVNQVVPAAELLPVSIALAGRIAAKSRRAVEATKDSLRAAWHAELGASLAANYWSHVALQAGPDVPEGLTAFIEKRPARFNRD
jgi:enoyl-CoA hydratase